MATDMNLSSYKNLITKLKNDGSNLDDWLYLHEQVVLAEDIENVYSLSLNPEGKIPDEQKKDMQLINPFSHPEQRPFISRLSDDELNETYKLTFPGMNGDEAKEFEKKKKRAFLYVVMSLPPNMLHHLKGRTKSAPVAVSIIAEHIKPTDNLSKFRLYAKLHDADLLSYKGNFDNMAKELRDVRRRLNALGENVTETYLLSRLFRALKPTQKFETVVTILKQRIDLTYDKAVAAIRSHIRDKAATLGEKPLLDRANANYEHADSRTEYRPYSGRRGVRGNWRGRSNGGRSRGRNNGRGRGRYGRWRGRDGRGRGSYGQGRGRQGGAWRRKEDNSSSWRDDDSYRYSSNSSYKKNSQCYNCGKYGHFANECRKRRRDKNNHNGDNNNSNQNNNSSKSEDYGKDDELYRKVAEIDGNLKMVLGMCTDDDEKALMNRLTPNFDSSIPANEDTKIMIDGGCSKPMFRNASLFTDKIILETPRTIEVGLNGAAMHAYEAGIVRLILMNRHGRRMKLDIQALYVPNASGNYIPHQYFEDMGYETRSSNGIMAFYNEEYEIGYATRSDDQMYYLRYVKSPKTEQIKLNAFRTMAVSYRNLMQLHRRLGHASLRKLIETAKATRGLYIPKNLPKELRCPICDVTKTRRPAIKTKSAEERKHNPLRLHADSKTGLSKSIHGNTGFTVTVHEGSRWAAIYPCKTTGAAKQHLKDHISKANGGNEKKVDELRSDGGGEFVSHDLQTWLKENGLKFTPSAPRTPEQNGMSERMIQTIMAKVRPSLKQAKAGKGFWEDAALAAVYVYNRTAHHALNGKTPYEVYHGERPNIDNLLPFGCIAVAPIDKEIRPPGGLGDRGEHVRVIGYDHRHNVYIVRTRKGLYKRTRLSKIYEDTFEFPKFEQREPVLVEGTPTRGIPAEEDIPARKTSPTTTNEDNLEFRRAPIKQLLLKKRILPKRNVLPHMTFAQKRQQEELYRKVATADRLCIEHISKEELQKRIRKIQQMGQADERRNLVIMKEKNLKPNRFRRGRFERRDEPIETRDEKRVESTHQCQHFPTRPEDEKTNTERDDNDVASGTSAQQEKDTEGFIENLMAISVHDIEDVPKTYKKAMLSSEKSQWEKANETEMRGLARLKTWSLTSKPKDASLVSSKWVYRKKLNADGTIRYKARLVARGFTQEHGINYFESYAPTMSLNSLRILIALSAAYGFGLHNVDIDNAYLNGQIDCEILMEIPEGLSECIHLFTSEDQQLFRSETPICCKLNKGLYGLKQAGHIWGKTLSEYLIKIGFDRLQTDTCIYTRRVQGRHIILGVYVDDIIIAYKTPQDIQWFLKALGKRFKFKNLGNLRYCLGIEVARTPGGAYFISQQKYIMRISEKYNIIPSKRARTTLSNLLKLYDYEDSHTVDPTAYRSILGAIIYVAVATRPDLSFAVSTLARFSQDPRAIHQQAAERLLQYMVNTCEYSIRYERKQNNNLTSIYVDASFNSDPKDSKSHCGYISMVNDTAVTWKAWKQTIVATSTGEAEYIAASDACREAVYLRQLIGELAFQLAQPTTMYSDSTSAITIATKPGFTQKSKSIRLKYHNTRQCIKDGIIDVKKIPGVKNPADIMTKGSSRAETQRHTDRLFYKPTQEYINILGDVSSKRRGEIQPCSLSKRQRN